ncbi:hypothetical protein LTR56_026279 [Elasticomyces elasticus]|nr:hypothetical protein LTR56_026279 [Elasticomyces elasticus]KAK5747788.1 hypothetical protein LTS12_022143 [Elasticomyces elasticus]
MLLSTFPSQLPTESEITRLREVFVDCSSGHVFLNQLQIYASTQERTAAPLSFAIACLASVHCRHAEAEARDLFLASRGLGGALMEIDNAESRSPDLLVAVMTMMILVRHPDIWDKSGQTLCTATTAIHFDLSAMLFTSQELCTPMPTSSFNFQDVYRVLLSGNQPVCPVPLGPSGSLKSEDGLLLLMALLSDLLYLRQSFEQVSSPTTKIGYNPFVPFTPHMEQESMESRLSLALETWYTWFKADVSSEVLALYYYSRMCLYYDRLLALQSFAGYGGHGSSASLPKGMSITDEAFREAWRVLDNAAARTQPAWADRLCPIWLPSVVFHAGLVVWAHHVLHNDVSHRHAERGSVRVLQAFKV